MIITKWLYVAIKAADVPSEEHSKLTSLCMLSTATIYIVVGIL